MTSVLGLFACSDALVRTMHKMEVRRQNNTMGKFYAARLCVIDAKMHVYCVQTAFCLHLRQNPIHVWTGTESKACGRFMCG